jgi:hypothetical protein
VVIDIDKLDGCHEEDGEKERGGFEAENKKNSYDINPRSILC